VLAAAAAPTALAAQEEGALPPADLLEYLGTWQDDDEEWFVEVEIDRSSENEADEKRRRADDEQK